jgi:hypothetical protein
VSKSTAASAGPGATAGDPSTASSDQSAASSPDGAQPWPDAWLTVPDVAERLGLLVTRVHQLLRDGGLVGVRQDRVMRIPADLITEDTVVKHLSGVIMLLRDARYDDTEIIRWLWTADDSLPGTPVQNLRSNRATEVKRRAQALGF